MSTIQFTPSRNIVSMYNRGRKQNFSSINKITKSESDREFNRIVSPRTRKGDKKYKQI